MSLLHVSPSGRHVARSRRCTCLRVRVEGRCGFRGTGGLEARLRSSCTSVGATWFEPRRALQGSVGHGSPLWLERSERTSSFGKMAHTIASGRPVVVGNDEHGQASLVDSTRRGSPHSARSPHSESTWQLHLGEGATQATNVRFKPGKPRRASGAPVRQRAGGTTDSPTDQGLEANHLAMAMARGHATTVTCARLLVEGNALEGQAPWECARSWAGMPARARQPGEPHGR